MKLSLRGYLEQKWRDRVDPIVVFPELADLQTVAAERGWHYHPVLPASTQVCPGARALSEDFLQWVEHGPHLLRVHRDAHRGSVFSRNWAAYLHSVRRYPMDKVFYCHIPKATITTGEGAVLTDRDELAREANLVPSTLRKSRYAQSRPKPKEGRFISLMTIWGAKNMGHFFFDAMLRVTLFERLDDFRFLVPPVLQPWHRGLFEVAGIQPHQLVNAEEGVTCVEELVGCHIATEGSMPRAELLRKFRDIALANAVTTPPARRNRRIFIDRSAAKRRKMANQKELEPVLAERGFEIVQWEQLSMPEQVRLAAETEIMAGPHGTSLLNSIYAPPGAKLLEIVNPHWWDAATLRQCTLMGHEFWYCFGEDASRDHDTSIDPRKLARVLDAMLDAPQTDPLFQELARGQLNKGMKDLILATSFGYSFEQLYPFLRSLQETGFEGETVFFVGSTSMPTANRLRKEGVKLKPFFYPFKRAHKMRNPLHRLWPLAQRVLRGVEKPDELAWWTAPFHNISSLRYLLYYRFCERRPIDTVISFSPTCAT